MITQFRRRAPPSNWTGQGQGRVTVLERKGNSWSQAYRGFFVTLYILVSTCVFPMCVEAYMFHCMYEIILHCNKHRQALYMFQMMPIAWSATPSAQLCHSPLGCRCSFCSSFSHQWGWRLALLRLDP